MPDRKHDRKHDRKDSQAQGSTELGPDGPSKSELKRRMLAAQELGESLTRLSEAQLGSLPIGDAQLLEAIRETRQINSNSARRRQLQFIGKLMRSIDLEPISRALHELQRPSRQQTDQFHQLEQLREQLLNEGVEGTDLVLQRWPEADRQQLRQLLLQHQRELHRGSPPTASRKLFRYLRELQKQEDG